MRLPWVSREEHDFLHSLYDDAMTRWVDRGNDLLAAERRFDSLLEKFTALRLQGATIPEPVVTRTPKDIDPLTQAVLNASAGKPPQVRAMMMKQLVEDRNNPLLEEMDIMRRIESGFASDDEGMPE